MAFKKYLLRRSLRSLLSPWGGSLPLGQWLTIIGALATLPVVLYSVLTSYKLYQEEKSSGQIALQRQASVAAAAIGRQVERSFTVLDTLAVSDAALRRELPAIHGEAERLVKVHDWMHAVQAIDTAGRVLFSSDRPYAEVIPFASSNPDALTKGHRRVGGLGQAEDFGRPTIPLAQLVRIPGVLDYWMQLSLNPASLVDVLREQQWPADWTGVLLDRDGIILARTRDYERYLGGRPSPTLYRLLEGGHEAGLTTTRDGVAVLTAVAKVPGTDWVVAVGQPVTGINNNARMAVLGVLAIGAASLLIGLGAAYALGASLRRDMEAVTRALEDPLNCPMPLRSIIREVDAFSVAYHDAEGRARAFASRLIDARHDPLTRLPGRALFFEKARESQERIAQAPGWALAVLFIDLDNFKQLNDRLGHKAGDAALVKTADTLRTYARSEDVIGRIGGDEFMVCLSGPLPRLEVVASEFSRSVITEIAAMGEGVGCSIGVRFANASEDLDFVVEQADAAMFLAKRSGKSTFVVLSKDGSVEPVVAD